MGLGEFVATNDSAPTAQLQRIRAELSINLYRSWIFRVTRAPRAFLKSVSPGREIYAGRPYSPGGNSSAMWGNLELLYVGEGGGAF